MTSGPAAETRTPGAGVQARPSERPADTLYDFVARLLGDDRAAAAAARELSLRAADRVREGLTDELDTTSLLRLARAHVERVTAVRSGSAAADAVTDLAVLDLLLRRGLSPRETAAITGVSRRAHGERRARAATVLDARDEGRAAAERAYVDAPLLRAPDEVRAAVAAALAAVPAPPEARPARRIAYAGAAVTVLAGLAFAAPPFVDARAGGPAVVTGVPVEYAPVSSTIAVGEEGEDTPASGALEDGATSAEEGVDDASDDATDEDTLVLPDDGEAAGSDDQVLGGA